jgi:hypothetical protein
MAKNVVINTKKMAIIIAALNAAGIGWDTLATYLIDLMTGGPSHDYGNFFKVEFTKIINAIKDDPIGWTLGIAVDVTFVVVAFKLLGWVISAFGGRKSVQIAKGVRWTWA